jgi:DNA-binding response OmpR family regulator
LRERASGLIDEIVVTTSEQTGLWRPVGYVTVEDRECRERIAAMLNRRGWLVIEPPTGFHVVQALSGLITGDAPWLRPGLIVVDAVARGCAGTTIAQGLRDLGLQIPVILVTSDRAPVLDRDVIVADPMTAPAVVGELAQPWSRLAEPPHRAVA